MSRRGVREQIFKLLFQVEFHPVEDMDVLFERFYDEEEPQATEEEQGEIQAKLNKILSQISLLDQMLAEKTDGWELKRLGKVELTILRLALYEMKFDDSVPVSVAINEAVELSKKYAQKDSYGFVNGVLAKFAE